MRSTPWKARRDAPPSTTTSPEASFSERVGSLRFVAADPEQAGVAERDRDHRRGEILLVAILMQAHLRRRLVVVDEAGFRIVRIARHLPPDVEHHRRDRRPRPAGLGVRRLIAIAAVLVRDPAERAEVGHPDGERLAGPRHASGGRTAPPLRPAAARRPAPLCARAVEEAREKCGSPPRRISCCGQWSSDRPDALTVRSARASGGRPEIVRATALRPSAIEFLITPTIAGQDRAADAAADDLADDRRRYPFRRRPRPAASPEPASVRIQPPPTPPIAPAMLLPVVPMSACSSSPSRRRCRRWRPR